LRAQPGSATLGEPGAHKAAAGVVHGEADSVEGGGAERHSRMRELALLVEPAAGATVAVTAEFELGTGSSEVTMTVAVEPGVIVLVAVGC